MEKAKIGISMGLFGLIIYIAALSGGFIPVILLTGYVLLKEENEWLKKTAIKALVTLVCFSTLSVIVSFIPDVLGVCTSSFRLIGVNLYSEILNDIFGVLNNLVSVIKTIVFILLAIKASKMQDMAIPVVDNLINHGLEFVQRDLQQQFQAQAQQIKNQFQQPQGQQYNNQQFQQSQGQYNNQQFQQPQGQYNNQQFQQSQGQYNNQQFQQSQGQQNNNQQNVSLSK